DQHPAAHPGHRVARRAPAGACGRGDPDRCAGRLPCGRAAIAHEALRPRSPSSPDPDRARPDCGVPPRPVARSQRRFRRRSRRRFGDVVRLELATGTPPEIRELLTRELTIGADQVYETAAPLGLAALAELAALDRPELKRAPWKPVAAHQFPREGGSALLAQI